MAERVGDRIRELRLAKDWTQKDLAARCGVSYAQISHIERGISRPSIETALRISRALGMPFDDLVGEKGPLVGEFGLEEPDEIEWVEAYRRMLLYRRDAAMADLERIKNKASHGRGHVREATEELVAFIIDQNDFRENRMDEAQEQWQTSHPSKLPDDLREAIDRMFATFGEFDEVIESARELYESLVSTEGKPVANLEQWLRSRSA